MDPTQLHGTWHIHFSDFPMWLKGDKKHPSITYSPHPTHPQDTSLLQDVVTYKKNGRQRTIRGVDHQAPDGRLNFRWRGSGLLFLLHSDWHVEYLSDDCQFMIIHFQPSLFTPAGYDILCRSKAPTPATIEEMTNIFHTLHPTKTLPRIPQG